MAARRLLAIIAISSSMLGGFALGQDSAVTVPNVQNSKYQFDGTVNADAVLVRAGPSDNYYPVARLDKGTTVTVVGITFDWLKILPPDGSFSYIAKAYVNKTSDTVGTVSHSAVNVRAGSIISPMKTAVQTKLGEGQTVDIIGEQDEYYKIKPPAGAYVYVNKQFITPGRLIGENPTTPMASTQPVPIAIGTQTMPEGVTPIEPTTQESTTPEPTTRFVIQTNSAENQFAELDQKLRDTYKEPLDKQPLADLLAGYNSVIADPELPATLKRLASSRVDYLNRRLQAQKDLAAAQQEDAALQAHNKEVQAQQQALQQKLATEEMHLFAAVGTLQTSSVLKNGESLYRLVDSANGRTLVYVRPSDPSLAQDLGQLVGIRGEINDDPSLGLKVITPTGIETLNSNELPKVTADIMPSGMTSTTTQP